MSDSVVKIRIDSQEYDAKLKRAGQALNQYFDTVRKGGGTLEYLDEGVLDAVKAMGQMATASSSARGKVGELAQAFTEMHVQYQQLTQAERQSPLGQAMQQSLDELHSRLEESKGQLDSARQAMDGVGNSSSTTGGFMDQLTQRLTVNLDAMKLMNVAWSAGKVALDVLRDAFFTSEQNVDDWGRTIAAGESIYQSFLQSLNSGDFSNFFSNLDNVVQKAKAAYDALDKLNTVMTIINPERARLQSRQQELRATIRRKGSDSAEGRAAQSELKTLEPKLQKAFGKEADMNMDVFVKEFDRKLAEGGLKLSAASRDWVLRTFSDSDAFARLEANARGQAARTEWRSANGWGSYKEYVPDTRNTNKKILDLFTDEWRQQWSPFLTASYNARGQAASMALGNSRYLKETPATGGGGRSGSPRGHSVQPVPVPTEKELTLQERIAAFEKEAYTASAERRKEIAVQVKLLDDELARQKSIRDELHGIASEKPVSMKTGAAGLTSENLQGWLSLTQKSLSESEVGGVDYERLAGQVLDGKTLQNVLQFQMEKGLKVDGDVMSGYFERLLDGVDITQADWEGLAKKINEQLQALGLDPIEIDVKTGQLKQVKKETKDLSGDWKDAAKGIQQVGSAMSQIEDPAAKVMGTIAQAIATIALSYAEALAKTKDPWTWLAFAATGLATTLSTISAIKTATAGSYEQGGIVPGSSWRGDNLTANVNSGELILSRAQQDVLAADLQGQGALSDLRLTTRVKGEDLIIALNATGGRTGRGKIVFSR